MSGYWDIPEGTDCPRKAWIMAQIGAKVGVVGSAYHMLVSWPDTVLQGIQRASLTTVSMATLGAIFGVTTCLSAHIRDEPDDSINYLIGGCTSGVMVGAKAHSFAVGTSACLTLGVTAMLVKMGKREGWHFFPPKT